MLRVAILVISLLPAVLYAQQTQPLSGYLVYVLGKDTTMAGYYELKGNQFSMEIVAKPNVSVTKMKGTLYPNGEIESAAGYSYRPIPGKDSQLLATYKLYVKGDSTFAEQQQTGRPVAISRFAGRGVMANAIGVSFRYFLPFLGRYAPTRVGDSLVTGHLTLGTNKKYIIKRKAADQLWVGSTVTGMMTLYLNKNGSLKSIDAIGSSWNVTGSVSDQLDLQGLTTRFLADENSAVAINLADSVQATINNTSLKIVYSRPKVRGRTIFGAVVPYDRFWRTGANAATRLVINHPIVFGDKELPVGAYSIWTIPSQKGWTMMFNSRANVWGTEYDPAFDVLRVPMQSEQITNPVELFTIEIKPVNEGGMLNILWEKTKASLEFRTK